MTVFSSAALKTKILSNSSSFGKDIPSAAVPGADLGGFVGFGRTPPQGSKEFLCSHYITFRER